MVNPIFGFNKVKFTSSAEISQKHKAAIHFPKEVFISVHTDQTTYKNWLL